MYVCSVYYVYILYMEYGIWNMAYGIWHMVYNGDLAAGRRRPETR